MGTAAYADGDAGRESPFELGAGGRGMGLGRAFVSLSGEAAAAFWNPAATALMDRSEFMAFHTALFMGTNYDCLALSHPVGNLGVFSVSAGRLGTGDIEQRDEFNRAIGSISSSESQLGLSYGKIIGFGLDGGITLKGVAVNIGDNAGYGFGADLGFQYRPRYFKGFALGLGFNDLVQPRIKLINNEDKFQTISRFGAAYSHDLSKNFGATIALETAKISGRSNQIRAGLETAFYNAYFLRLGYDRDRPTFGAGISYNMFKLDYAYENIDQFGGSHRVSLSFQFGPSLQQSQKNARAEIVREERLSWENSLSQQRTRDFNLFVARADSLRQAGRYQDAMSNYERALALDESSASAKAQSDSMMSLIIAQAVTNSRDEKREDLVAKRVEQALEDLKAGRYNEAISQYEIVLDIDPGNKSVTDLLESAKTARKTEIESSRARAGAFRAKGDFSNAILEWNKILALDPTDPQAKLSIDLSRNQLKADALVSSAINAMNSGKYTDAVDYLQQAHQIRPKDANINSLLTQARAKSAPATNLESIKAADTYWAVYLKGLESYQAGDYKSALQSWESLQEFYPNNPELEKNIAQARQRLLTEGGKGQD